MKAGAMMPSTTRFVNCSKHRMRWSQGASGVSDFSVILCQEVWQLGKKVLVTILAACPLDMLLPGLKYGRSVGRQARLAGAAAGIAIDDAARGQPLHGRVESISGAHVGELLAARAVGVTRSI